MYSLDIDLKDFSSAHRLIKNYQGKCNNLHGHNYSVAVRISAMNVSQDDDLVIDFTKVRQVCDAWVQGNLDHTVLIYKEDFPLLEFAKTHRQKHFVMNFNTTVECLAKVIFDILNELLSVESGSRETLFYLEHVIVRESQQCAAVYSEGGASLTGMTCGQ
jgi:6-pyruvoyltetrahydropterin/6-carboxytetrahydropterin synthase